VNLSEIKEGWLRYLMSAWFKQRQPNLELQKHLDHRFETCTSCPHMVVKTYSSKRNWRTCGKCGCAFPALMFAYGKKCPDGRWQEIDKDIWQPVKKENSHM